jgi:hypothetical protein
VSLLVASAVTAGGAQQSPGAAWLIRLRLAGLLEIEEIARRQRPACMIAESNARAYG